jgi:hypothetical protein
MKTSEGCFIRNSLWGRGQTKVPTLVGTCYYFISFCLTYFFFLATFFLAAFLFGAAFLAAFFFVAMFLEFNG